MRSRQFISIFLAICVIGLVVGVRAAMAAQQTAAQQGSQLALGVTPAITEIVLEPGKQKKATIAVGNITNAPVPVKATTASMVPHEEIAEKDRAMFDASTWLRLSETEFILQPGQQKQIIVTATAPQKAEPGGHYATIFFQPVVAAEVITANAAYVGSKVGVLAFMTVKGNIQEQLSVERFSSNMLVHQKGSIPITVSLRNAGNVHVLPVGWVEIFDVSGKRIDTLPLPTSIVLPKTTKDVRLEWDNKGRLGLFTARLAIKYGAHNITLVERFTIVIVPWLWSVVLALLGGFLVAVIWRWRGRWRRAFKMLFAKQGHKPN